LYAILWKKLINITADICMYIEYSDEEIKVERELTPPDNFGSVEMLNKKHRRSGICKGI